MSNLELFKDAVETIWTGVTPASDGSSEVYRFVDSFVEERGNGQHRELKWRLAQGADNLCTAPVQDEWLIECVLILHRTPPGQSERTDAAFFSAAEAEATDLQLAFEQAGAAQFDASTLEPLLDRFRLEGLDDRRPAGAPESFFLRARIVFPFRVLVQE